MPEARIRKHKMIDNKTKIMISNETPMKSIRALWAA
jgi:hypothetical protein